LIRWAVIREGAIRVAPNVVCAVVAHNGVPPAFAVINVITTIEGTQHAVIAIPYHAFVYATALEGYCPAVVRDKYSD